MGSVSKTVYLPKPRGFCAGVIRAIDIVTLALEKLGRPVYVRKEIVHNRFVVDELAAQGAVFVETLGEVPDGAITIFSAHGVAPEVWDEVQARKLRVIDATCPLVIKVHIEVIRYARENYSIILIGHPNHDEVIGTYGEAPGAIHLVSSVADVDALEGVQRSEEHTSELQSLAYLVCRLLLEKKTREARYLTIVSKSRSRAT